MINHYNLILLDLLLSIFTLEIVLAVIDIF